MCRATLARPRHRPNHGRVVDMKHGTCSYLGCGRIGDTMHEGVEFCITHHKRATGESDIPMDAPIRAMTPGGHRRSPKTPAPPCKWLGCPRTAIIKEYCNTHYLRSVGKSKVPMDAPVDAIPKKRRIYVEGDICEMRDCVRRPRAAGYCLVHSDRHITLLGLYGIGIPGYLLLLDAQGGRCAMCGTAEPRSDNLSSLSFQVDHDHRCCPGKKCCGACIRGLLCGRCNFLLGNASDDPELLRAGIAYLDRWTMNT